MSYDRRSFLKTSSAATAGITLSGLPFVSCASGPAADNLKYGIQLYTVRNDVFKNVETTLQYLAKAGYTQIELFGFDGSKFFGKTPKELKALFDANGLTAPSGHYYLPPVLYDGNRDIWKATLEAANTMGSEYVVIPWLDDKHRSAEDFKKLVGTINELAVLTKDAGMKLSYHNHEFEFGKAQDGKTYFQHLLDGTDQGMIDFEMDMFWVVYAKENPADWFNRYPGRFSMWHFKDGIVKADGTHEYTPTGDGEVKFDEIFKHREHAGLKYLFSEQDECKGRTLKECIEKSISNMKKKKWGNS
jgi:sugar phosphate isomerase/epimerase